MRKILYIFGQLSDLDVEWIKNNAIKERVGTGTSIITENESLNKLIIIIRGKFSVTSIQTGKKEIALLKSGEVLGEMSFIENLPPSATVTSKEDGIIIAIDKDKLNEKLAIDNEFAAHFYKAIGIFLASRLRSTVGMLGYDNKIEINDDIVYEDEIDL
ncbi:uncharacterized protein METZ01_LOCUS467278, partial [marine metagenome]